MASLTVSIAACAVLGVRPALAQAGQLAATPPMGWNSWDAYGLTIDESEFLANASVLAGLKEYGWKYVIIDEGWYMQNPFVEGLEHRGYVLDAHGLLVPAPTRFPSSAGGKGFKPLADWVHARGLAFGLHIVRGIPKPAVRENLPIARSPFHAREAAETSDTCPWDDGNYGIADNAAGQAYYDSMLRLYADWGVDFIKVDCIADRPYKPNEIRQIATAIARTGRPIVLSLSPGPTQLDHAAEVSRYAQMWRIANDRWDGWVFPHAHPQDDFPNGVLSAFDGLANWYSRTGPGHWPDADMLPIGSLTPHPGWGVARESRLTHEEERCALTLWSIARSPLILGGNLTRLDAYTRSLITNRDVLEVNQRAFRSRPLASLPPTLHDLRVWVATLEPARQAGTEPRAARGASIERQTASRGATVVAVFNLGEMARPLSVGWQELSGGPAPQRHARDLWSGRVDSAPMLNVTLPAHGCAMYQFD